MKENDPIVITQETKYDYFEGMPQDLLTPIE